MAYYGASGRQGEAVALSEAIGYSLDIEIDDYALVNMQGFAEVIDAVGGVTLELGDSVPLPPSLPGEHPLPASIGPGLVEMDGAMAIAYARSRSADSDYQRMGRQRQLLAALGSQVSAGEAVSGFGSVTGVLGDSMRTSLSAGEFSSLLDRLGDNAAIGESVGLVPPLVEPGSPDYAQIRRIVNAVEQYVLTGESSGLRRLRSRGQRGAARTIVHGNGRAEIGDVEAGRHEALERSRRPMVDVARGVAEIAARIGRGRCCRPARSVRAAPTAPRCHGRRGRCRRAPARGAGTCSSTSSPTTRSMLRSTNGIRVASPKNIGTSISSHSSARLRVGQVEADDGRVREALDEALGDATLAGADLDDDVGLEPGEHAVEGAEEAGHHASLDRVLRGVLVVVVAGDVARLRRRARCRTVAVVTRMLHPAMSEPDTPSARPIKLVIQIPCFNEEETLPATHRRSAAPGAGRRRRRVAGDRRRERRPHVRGGTRARRRSRRAPHPQPWAGGGVHDRASTLRLRGGRRRRS